MTSPDTEQLAAAATSAAATTGLTHAQALQSALTDLSTLTVSQLVAFFQQYQSVPNFTDLLKQAFPQIVIPHATAAAAVTAQWYDDIAATKKFTAKPVVDIPQARLDKTLGWSLYAPTKQLVPEDFVPREAVDVPQTVPFDVTLSRLAGSTKRMVFDASRDTVVSNAFQQGIRWARVAQPDACAFCRLLASKTGSSRALYHTEASGSTVVGRTPSLSVADRRKRAAGLVTTDQLLERAYDKRDGAAGAQRGSQEIGEKYHDHCRCVAVPVPNGQEYEAPDYTAQWSQDYKDAVKATKSAGRTKGKYGAIDIKAVLAHMRANTDAH